MPCGLSGRSVGVLLISPAWPAWTGIDSKGSSSPDPPLLAALVVQLLRLGQYAVTRVLLYAGAIAHDFGDRHD